MSTRTSERMRTCTVIKNIHYGFRPKPITKLATNRMPKPSWKGLTSVDTECPHYLTTYTQPWNCRVNQSNSSTQNLSTIILSYHRTQTVTQNNFLSTKNIGQLHSLIPRSSCGFQCILEKLGRPGRFGDVIDISAIISVEICNHYITKSTGPS